MKPTATIFFRTQSPRHFEGGDWDQGGSCQRSSPLLLQEVNLSIIYLDVSENYQLIWRLQFIK